MKLATYKNADGGMEMMREDSALDEIRALGKVFTSILAERGKSSNESDLMAGLAAYTMLDLKGDSARTDAAHRLVMGIIADEMFARLRAA
jgi:hypothetical protein